jgi:hypothetical protein
MQQRTAKAAQARREAAAARCDASAHSHALHAIAKSSNPLTDHLPFTQLHYITRPASSTQQAADAVATELGISAATVEEMYLPAL